MLRVPIGGTDFSTRAYAYNELPENDVTLSNFTLAYEDYEYKVKTDTYYNELVVYCERAMPSSRWKWPIDLSL